ncbi:carbohydrate-binding protein [Vallitalea sp.]|uniref:carbohydrate-binding protein n=1 Tax=Vallitalea sp. TaxID=1882829 RepID=UPI0025DCFAE8|nr:carbohydrate-binding protein [Vallitalea sp.]MCT4686521.1 CBM21 domain-containing protein [Vallitalea sp.]
MKKSVKLLMSISLCMVMVLGLFSINIRATEDKKVALYYAKIKEIRDHGVIKGWTTTGKIAVRDLGDSKNVVVHYTNNGGKTWSDISASYLKTSSDGYDIYIFETPMYPWNGYYYYKYNSSFAIKVENDGQIFWDNNNGENYSLNISSTNCSQDYKLNKSKLLLKSNYKNESGFHGTVIINDFNSNKILTVRYTTDNWKTYKDVKAYKNSCYQPYTDMELWTFDIIENAETYEFAIKCEINGQTYWDNNFGDNYIYNKPF